MKKILSVLSPWRLRLLLRGAFLLLIVATIAMALYLLSEEKQLSYQNYQNGFRKTQAQIIGKLRHPTGQLALLNPQIDKNAITPLRPLLLPFSALDFDDQYKVQQAVEMSGCLVQYESSGALCVAIGNNPWAGGFIYVAGHFFSGALQEHKHGDKELQHAHRVQLNVWLRGTHYRWLAPFEDNEDLNAQKIQGRLTGFAEMGDGTWAHKPDKDFRGWLWQDTRCAETANKPIADDSDNAGCSHRSFYSVRLPVGVLRDALFNTAHNNARPIWPPADLDQIQVRVEVLSPDDGPVLFDSNSPDAIAPFTLDDLKPLLLPGEMLKIHKRGGSSDLLTLVGSDEQAYHSSPLISSIIKRIPVENFDNPIAMDDTVDTAQGHYDVTFNADIRSLNRNLSAVATRVSWFVGAMLLAIFLAWIVIEVGIIRRIIVLTRRASSVSKSVKGAGHIEQFNLTDLRGDDELGVLANCLSALLQRVKEDVEREQIRAEQEKDMWHAVGHEIMSPLQSLMALHASGNNDSSRYINRMQQAIKILYGSASPSEAFQSSALHMQTVNLHRFLHNIAINSPCVGIANVLFISNGGDVLVRADEYSLEDVITHILRNAERYRHAGTPITVELEASETAAVIRIHNCGPAIADNFIDKIFEYGVSDQVESGANGNRGQGLFVAKTYMAKMGGTVSASNTHDGVCFMLGLQRVASNSN